jgi:hypothetical protein
MLVFTEHITFLEWKIMYISINIITVINYNKCSHLQISMSLFQTKLGDDYL